MTEEALRGWLAVAKDVLHALHLPGGETLGRAVEKAIEKRNRDAFEILLSEIARGEADDVRFDESDVPVLADMALRFSAAAAKGTARRNLHLLGQVIVGLKRNRAFAFDRFQKWANVLETLTRDEILMLASAYRTAVSDSSSDTFWRNLIESLSNSFSKDEVQAIAASLSRTGLLLPASGWGTLVYSPGPGLQEIGSLAELEENAPKQPQPVEH